MIKCGKDKTIFDECYRRRRKTFCDMENVHVCDIGSICIHGKELLGKLSFLKKKKISQWNKCSTCLRNWQEQSDEICGVKTINWGDSSWKHFFDWWRGSRQSLAREGLRIFRFCDMSWKGELESNTKYCLGGQLDVVQKFITLQNFGHNWRRANGIREEYFPRVHHIAALPQSPRVTVKIERRTRKYVLDLRTYPRGFERRLGLFLSVYVDDIKLAGKKQNLDPMWKVLNKEVDLGEPTSFLDHENLGCTRTSMKEWSSQVCNLVKCRTQERRDP